MPVTRRRAKCARQRPAAEMSFHDARTPAPAATVNRRQDVMRTGTTFHPIAPRPTPHNRRLPAPHTSPDPGDCLATCLCGRWKSWGAAHKSRQPPAIRSDSSSTAPAPALDALEMFKARCDACAYLYAAGDVPDPHHAADALQDQANWHGLINRYGQDPVRRIAADLRAIRAGDTPV